MNLFFLLASLLGAEAFVPASKVGLSSTALNNYARSKWSPGSVAPSVTTGFSPFSPVSSAATASASSSPVTSYARSKWSPGSAAPSTGFSPFSSASGGGSTSSVPYDDIRAMLKSMMDVSCNICKLIFVACVFNS